MVVVGVDMEVVVVADTTEVEAEESKNLRCRLILNRRSFWHIF